MEFIKTLQSVGQGTPLSRAEAIELSSLVHTDEEVEFYVSRRSNGLNHEQAIDALWSAIQEDEESV